jgi:hypothetical protein
MKELSPEEAAELQPMKSGKHNWLYKKLSVMQVNAGIIIRFADWKTKNTPYATIRRAAKNLKREFDYGRHPDGSGWLVKRVR